MALICRMWITLRNGVKYSRPDGRPICWNSDRTVTRRRFKKPKLGKVIEEVKGEIATSSKSK